MSATRLTANQQQELAASCAHRVVMLQLACRTVAEQHIKETEEVLFGVEACLKDVEGDLARLAGWE